MKHIPSQSFRMMMAAAGLVFVSSLAWWWSLSSPSAGGAVFVAVRPAVEARFDVPPEEIISTDDHALSPADVRVEAEAEELRSDEDAREAEVAAKLTKLRAELAVAEGLNDRQQRDESIARICYRWAEFDPREALALACRLQLSEAGALENLTQQWASVDLPAARAWIAAQPPSEIKLRLVTRAGFLMAQKEPENAANYVLDETPPGEVQTEAVITVIHQWAQQDRRAALAWAQKFPEGALRERALQEVSLPVGQEVH